MHRLYMIFKIDWWYGFSLNYLYIYKIPMLLCIGRLPVLLFYVYTHICIHVYMCLHMCVFTWMSYALEYRTRIDIGCLPGWCSTLFLKHVLSQNLELTNLSRLTGHGAPKISLSLHPQFMLGLNMLGFSCAVCLDSVWVLMIPTAILKLEQQAL